MEFLIVSLPSGSSESVSGKSARDALVMWAESYWRNKGAVRVRKEGEETEESFWVYKEGSRVLVERMKAGPDLLEYLNFTAVGFGWVKISGGLVIAIYKKDGGWWWQAAHLSSDRPYPTCLSAHRALCKVVLGSWGNGAFSMRLLNMIGAMGCNWRWTGDAWETREIREPYRIILGDDMKWRWHTPFDRQGRKGWPDPLQARKAFDRSVRRFLVKEWKRRKALPPTDNESA